MLFAYEVSYTWAMDNSNKELHEFLYKYEAKAYLSSKMYRRCKHIRFDYKDFDTAFDTLASMPTEDEPYVEMLIPQDKFRHLVEMEEFVNKADKEYQWAQNEMERQRKDAWIRQKNESVRKAYERYQTLLNLVRYDYD